jgi:hypothetical protein
MATVTSFSGASFDSEATRAMASAYDKACGQIQQTGLPVIVNEIVAKRIIRLAAEGERDPNKLCERAISALGTTSDRSA